MPARVTRAEARERLLKTILAALDRVIPADESVPLRGSTFGDWEGRAEAFRRRRSGGGVQAEAFRRAVVPTLLEERAALADNARVASGGRCPRCGSASAYLEKQTTRPEVLSPDGPVVVETHSTAGAAPVGGVVFPPPEP